MDLEGYEKENVLVECFFYWYVYFFGFMKMDNLVDFFVVRRFYCRFVILGDVVF